jgi:hypothetical protein
MSLGLILVIILIILLLGGLAAVLEDMDTVTDIVGLASSASFSSSC